MELFKQTNFDFLGRKWPFISASLLLTLAGFVSLGVKGGPKYGIDFSGGALMDVNFVHRPPAEQIRKALGSRINGEIEVQELGNGQGVLISTNAKDDRALEAVRSTIVGTLDSVFNRGGSGKLDLNQTGIDRLIDALRDVAGQAGVSEQALRIQAGAILGFRDNHSGLIRSFNELAGVPGISPQMMSALRDHTFLGQFHVGRAEIVSPKIGKDLQGQAINVVLIALAAMLVYIAFRFEWIYGVAAVIAVFHDTIITIGLFSLFNKQIDLTVIAALLTLVGYSMNDTIVVFDRIRENLRLNVRGTFSQIVNLSINQTLSRTVLTSGLTFLTALSLWIFGGQVLNGFSFALVVGIIVGTYSSVFIASPILIFWQDISTKRRQSGVSRTGTPVRKTNVGVPAGDRGRIKAAK